jgi:ribosomal protein S27AE
MTMIDKMLCPKCGGEFRVAEVEDRETGRKLYGLECSRCEYLDFDTERYRSTK